jgi:hypothetical protein
VATDTATGARPKDLAPPEVDVVQAFGIDEEDAARVRDDEAEAEWADREAARIVEEERVKREKAWAEAEAKRLK